MDETIFYNEWGLQVEQAVGLHWVIKMNGFGQFPGDLGACAVHQKSNKTSQGAANHRQRTLLVEKVPFHFSPL